MVLVALEKKADLCGQGREVPEADIVDDRAEVEERDRRERAPRFLKPSGEVRTIQDIDSGSFK